MFTTVLFDLDETLYPRRAGLMEHIGQRITDYLTVRMGVPTEKAIPLRAHFRGTYGTALRGLMEEGWPVDLDDYFAYVHDIPLDAIGPDARLRTLLLDLPLRRAILTNSNVEHATRIVQHMAIGDCFERIIDIKALGLINKPDPRAYQLALEMLGVDARETIFVEDTPVNTGPAKALGITTILVSHPPSPDADHHAADVFEAIEIIGRLIAPGGKQ
jgi:putative hydrolase of the HAD superfamily